MRVGKRTDQLKKIFRDEAFRTIEVVDAPSLDDDEKFPVVMLMIIPEIHIMQMQMRIAGFIEILMIIFNDIVVHNNIISENETFFKPFFKKSRLYPEKTFIPSIRPHRSEVKFCRESIFRP